MTDAISAETRRADRARAELISDIRKIKQMGDEMIEKTEAAVHKAPVLIGLGAVGLALVGVAVLVGRRPKPRLFGFQPPRSFFAEAARGAALSALGVISGRLTQRLLTSALEDSTQKA
ncbi:MAG TPA: hypothetical protein VHV51_02185 [Polyangiaceae bacterium]|jgi:hypothetical protein|nr:hypothetical protein [Polyangiaceae bacterium]